MVPAVGAVVDGVQQQALVRGIGGQVGRGEQGAGDAETGAEEAGGGRRAHGVRQHGQAQQTLGGDGRGGAVHRLVVIERIRRRGAPVAGGGQAGRAGVPVGNAVGGAVGEVELAGRRDRGPHPRYRLRVARQSRDAGLGHRLRRQRGEVLQHLRAAENGPCQTARPGRERRISLLRGGAAVAAVVDVEQRLVGHPPGYVVVVAPGAEVDVVAEGGFEVLQQAPQQRDAAVALAHQHLPQLVRRGQHPQRANGVDEQRLRAVEGTDIAQAVGQRGPARRLHRAGDPDRQLQVLAVARRGRPASFLRQAQQVAVGAHGVEAVVVHPGMGEMRRHHAVDAGAAQLQQAGVAGGVEGQQRGAVLEPLGPLGPAAGGVLAAGGEHRRPARGVPGRVQGADLGAGQGEYRSRGRLQVARLECGVNVHFNLPQGYRRSRLKPPSTSTTVP